MVGAAFGVIGIVAALTFGVRARPAASEQPASSGWNWTFVPEASEADVAAMVDVPTSRASAA